MCVCVCVCVYVCVCVCEMHGRRSNTCHTHKCLTTCQQMIAVRVVLLENRQFQEPSTVNSRNLKPSTPGTLNCQTQRILNRHPIGPSTQA